MLPTWMRTLLSPSLMGVLLADNVSLDERVVDAGMWQWARGTADESCDVACRLNNGMRDRGQWWEGLEQAADQVCWGCDKEPWPNERSFGHQIWHVVHHGAGTPIRQVSARTNLWSVPCPRGIERRGRGTRCLIGHFVYGIMCFFKWMGHGSAEQENFGLTTLESVMDLAFIVNRAPCRKEWAFPVAEVAENYERLLTLVWHRHQPVPERWLRASGPLRCWRPRPPEPQELAIAEESHSLEGIDSTPGRAIKVWCLVLALYPQEQERMAMITETYADQCDILTFFVASKAVSHFRGYAVVNLRHWFGIAADPPPGQSAPSTPNTIEKTFAALQYAAMAVRRRDSSQKPDVICRLDSDTLFLPHNLRRIMACRNFSAAAPWALGHENYAHKHQQPGHVFLNGGTGICLSRRALELLLVRMETNFLRSSHAGDWSKGGCLTAPGHWDDVVLGACLASLNVPISRWGTDCLGRSLFWPDRIQFAFPGPDQVRPRRLPPKGSFFQPPSVQPRQPAIYEDTDDTIKINAEPVQNTSAAEPFIFTHQRRESEVANYHFWLYRVWQHLACDERIWLAEYPVGFHPYRNRTEGKRAFRLFHRQEKMKGYAFRIWSGEVRDGGCDSILC
eukprot:TRINITY_DN76633_c0_g1_i1.p1 TRINITY_DN76633_c0_g1~~TRINITY_DN76633_c0_g1_i1.p1  ORF type:complete len:620 (-),score=83.86 TRINITY_DN76633_c0_g1_i1:58-1917(-)